MGHIVLNLSMRSSLVVGRGVKLVISNLGILHFGYAICCCFFIWGGDVKVVNLNLNLFTLVVFHFNLLRPRKASDFTGPTKRNFSWRTLDFVDVLRSCQICRQHCRYHSMNRLSPNHGLIFKCCQIRASDHWK